MTYTIEQLINKCIIQDSVAQTYLYNKYSPKLLKIAKRYSKNTEDAEDALATAFVSIFDKIKSYNGGYNKENLFYSWMCRIVINKALNIIRINKKHNILIFETDYMSDNTFSNIIIDTNNVLGKFEYKNIINKITKLPKGQQNIFNLYIDGYKHQEIAEILNITAATSKTQYMRAKIKLQKTISY